MIPHVTDDIRSNHVRILRNDQSVFTQGLSTTGQSELRARFSDPELHGAAAEFLVHIANYLMRSSRRIQSGETVEYGYWATRFVNSEDALLEAEEFDVDFRDFVPGVTRTLRYWREQKDVCDGVGAQFSPPRADRLAAVSDGVLEGDPVDAVRYPSPEHMSGWWFSTDRYNGDISSMRTEHLYHVTAKRPELAKYLALPPGFRFQTRPGFDGAESWFDPKVAAQPV